MGRTEHRDRQDGEEGGDSGKKRIELSVSQVAGAGVATLAAATAASYLNVYGTVVGAAVMATLSTLASPFLQQWFSRGGDHARLFAERTVGYAEPGGTGSHRSGTHPLDPPGTGPVPGLPPTGPLPGLPGEPDTTRTMAMPAVGADAAAAQSSGADAAGPRPGGPRTPDGPPGGGQARRGWRAYALTAAAVFVLVMLVVLLFELFTGRSLTAWTQGRQEYTSPTLLGGGTSAPPAQEEGGTGGAPADREEPAERQEDGTGQGGRDPVEEPAEPGSPDPGTGPPEGEDGWTDPDAPGDGGTTGPGEGWTDPGAGGGGTDPGDTGGTEGSGGAGGGTGDAVPDLPAG
ncbi:hypothetical protein SUDANB121_05248 [Nocardiopsis dassonvillei]|uniref:hypothetical protein n=1 Tax=Nocardiopsis dassonvillei TaxID=2014 RepID=UPI003F564B15